VRGGTLGALLADLFADGVVPLCDAETDDDLDAVVRACTDLGPGIRLLGTGGLAGAVGRLLAPSGPAERRPSPPAERPLLVVVGTAEPSAAAQIARLVAEGARHIALPAQALGGPAADVPPLSVAPAGTTVVSIDGSGGFLPGAARALAAGLARTVAAVPVPVDLVLTGGETARRVLDALGIAELAPRGQIHHGAVHATTADGRAVVTRPGSYGGTDSLLTIVRALRPGRLRGSVPRGSVPQGPVSQAPVPEGPASRGSIPRASVPRASVPRGEDL
jgi:uncharacterized protein YgbK (DUF1537 family)